MTEMNVVSQEFFLLIVRLWLLDVVVLRSVVGRRRRRLRIGSDVDGYLGSVVGSREFDYCHWRFEVSLCFF